MRAHRADYAVATMCRVLEVSTSGYYAWLKREKSARALEDIKLKEEIRKAHTASRGTYGGPRIHAELVENGIAIGVKRVARLMKEVGLEGVTRRKGTKTTRREKNALKAPDLVNRDFSAESPNKLWIADMTNIPTWLGFLYLAVVIDVFSRRVVGWSMRSHLRAELVREALDMAIWNRRPEGVIHHSDQGCQYTSFLFGRRCREAGIALSMGSVGDCYDNAMCESFFASLECELISRSVFRNWDQARLSVFDYIESWYNPTRRHSALGYLSPIDFERRRAASGKETRIE